MSTQSGIKATNELIDIVNDGSMSALVITLSSDSTQLIIDEAFKSPINSNLTLILSALKQHFSIEYPSPRFAIISSNDSHEGYFVSFIPDSAPIRNKMLYASTKNTLLQQLGSRFSKKNIVDFSELRELEVDEFTRVVHNEENFGLTAKEKDLQALHSLETLSISHASANVYKRELPSMDSPKKSSLLYKIDKNLDQVLRSDLSTKLVAMNINTVNETLSLNSQVPNVSAKNLVSILYETAKCLSEPSPVYALLGLDKGKLAFIYACPSGCRVKLRIMYAANKQGLLSHLKTDYFRDQEIAEIIEVGDFDEINTAVLHTSSDQFSIPKSDDWKLKFSKPKGPRRM